MVKDEEDEEDEDEDEGEGGTGREDKEEADGEGNEEVGGEASEEGEEFVNTPISYLTLDLPICFTRSPARTTAGKDILDRYTQLDSATTPIVSPLV